LILVVRDGYGPLRFKKMISKLIFKYRCVKMLEKWKRKGSKCELNFNGSDLWGKKGTRV
jgi:hypothetical protein